VPAAGRTSIAEACGEWRPQGVYLNTASYGLPPDRGWNDLQQALADWRAGATSWEHWGRSTERARAAFAAMVGAETSAVAVGATVSGLVGVVASSLPDGARVLAPDIEFTSTLFPFMVHGARGVTVQTVPAARLAEAIDDRTDVVAFSAVQMATGEVADLTSITRAARAHGALTVIDATQACGWLAVDAGSFDVVVCAAYKWLMSPRGTAFMVVDARRLSAIVPTSAGWYAGEDPHATYFGPPLRLASDARRLDTSPAWFSWVGTAPALELINEIGVEAIGRHDVGLANRFRAGLGLPPSDSAIAAVKLPGADDRLRSAGIVAAIRGGRLRTSWHVYNTPGDVDRVLDVVAG